MAWIFTIIAVVVFFTTYNLVWLIVAAVLAALAYWNRGGVKAAAYAFLGGCVIWIANGGKPEKLLENEIVSALVLIGASVAFFAVAGYGVLRIFGFKGGNKTERY